MVIDLTNPLNGPILDVIRTQSLSILEGDAIPPVIREFLLTDSEIVIVPLQVHDRVIGVIIADNRFTGDAISEELQGSLRTLAKAGAVAIENRRLYHEATDRAVLLRSLYQASNELQVTGDIQADLSNLVRQAQAVSRATDVRVILMNDAERPQQIITAVHRAPLDLSKVVRADGLSVRAFRHQQVLTVRDIDLQRRELNPYTFHLLTGAALCFPLVLRKTSLGVVWFLFDSPREFNESEIEALQFYVNQAALVCDSILRLQQLDLLHGAVRRIWSSRELEAFTLQSIVATVKDLFHSDWCTLWPYDAGRQRFLPQLVHSTGIDPELLAEPQEGRTTYQLIENGYVEELMVAETDLPAYRFLITHNVRSFRGVALKIGNDPVGVLYLAYLSSQVFSTDDRKLLLAFAPYAALVLSKAMMLAHLEREREAAELSNMSADTVEGTLQKLAESTQAALQCDAVTLYAYDAERELVDVYLPALVGVKYREQVLALRKNRRRPASISRPRQVGCLRGTKIR